MLICCFVCGFAISTAHILQTKHESFGWRLFLLELCHEACVSYIVTWKVVGLGF